MAGWLFAGKRCGRDARAPRGRRPGARKPTAPAPLELLAKSRRSPLSRAGKLEIRPAYIGKPYASSRPEVLKRRKSATFAVARDAPSASAAAAIMQSTNDPRRLPDSLNKRAAITACSGVKSRRCPTISSANSISEMSEWAAQQLCPGNGAHAQGLARPLSSPAVLRSSSRPRIQRPNQKAGVQVNHDDGKGSRRAVARRSCFTSCSH